MESLVSLRDRRVAGTPTGTPIALSRHVGGESSGALDDLHKHCAYQGDDDLVFGHPHTGKPLDRSQVLKRFKRYCKAAGIRPQRFHEYADPARYADLGETALLTASKGSWLSA
jgi:hypothetical protein